MVHGKAAESEYFDKDLFRKVFYFEWALLIICSGAKLVAWRMAVPDPSAPDLRVSLILLGVVGALSVIVPVKGSYWDRFCFLLLELLVMTGATAAGLQRFLFPLFVVVVAKACLLLDKRGMIAVFISAVLASITYATFKIYLQAEATHEYAQVFKHHFDLMSGLILLAMSLVYVYVAIVFMVLVAFLTLALKAEGESRRETERLSKTVQQLATEVERGRIAREIHDTLGHTLTSLNIQLDVARRFAEREQERSSEALSLAKELASQSLKDVRLAIQSIRTAADFNLNQAVSGLVQDVKHTQQAMDVQLDMAVEDVPASIGYQVFRVLQECLTNVLRHAEASEVEIQLAQLDGQLRLQVRDNGKGLETGRLTPGFGIRGMQERIESMHGTVAIEAAPNKGTLINVQIPLKAADFLETPSNDA
jgi:signal transduction histidine kinase